MRDVVTSIGMQQYIYMGIKKFETRIIKNNTELNNTSD